MEVNVADLISRADELMERAEERIGKQFDSAYPLLQQAVENLFKAFLYQVALQQESELTTQSRFAANSAGNVGVLFEQCRRLAPEFETIEEIAGYFTHEAPADPDPESISDAANEIWDFVIDLLSGEDEADEEEVDPEEE